MYGFMRKDASMNFQDEWKKILVLFIQDLSIKKKKKEDLSDCLMCYSKDKLIEISHINEMPGSRTGQSKDMLVTELAKKVEENFHWKTAYLTKKQLQTLMDKNVTENEKLSLEDVVELEHLFPLIDLGWLFLFKDLDGYALVLPTPLREALLATSTDENASLRIAHIHKMQDVLSAMMHMYGVFDLSFFVTVWNLHFPNETVSKKETEIFFLLTNELEDEVGILGDLVFHPDHFEEEDAEEFWHYLMPHDRYVPSKQDLIYYQQQFFDTRTAHYRKLRLFLEKIVSKEELPLIEENIWTHVKFDQEPGDLLDVFGDIIPGFLSSEKDIRTFLTLYIDLLNHARKWTTLGYTPDEMMRQKQGSKQAKGNIIPFPSWKQDK